MTILDQPQQQVQSIVYASFVERVVARLIDVMILIIPSLFIPFITSWLYYALMEGSERGATVGKRAMGIRVVSEEGHPIGFGPATGRFFANFLNIITLGIGYLLMFFNTRSQCLHDTITRTIVIKDDRSVRRPQYTQPFQQKRSWTSKVSDTETHFVEINQHGGRHWHRTATGEQVNDFTLWQLTDGLLDLSMHFDDQDIQEMKRYAEEILRGRG